VENINRILILKRWDSTLYNIQSKFYTLKKICFFYIIIYYYHSKILEGVFSLLIRRLLKSFSLTSPKLWRSSELDELSVMLVESWGIFIWLSLRLQVEF